ncbi:MAG: hypothetical protein ACYS0K_03860 [Planctomycetota bacterium]|jgi:hypothetical protein
MRRGSRIRRLARWVKWACTAAAVLILMGWMVPARFEIDVTQAHSIAVQEGNLTVRMWPTPRIHCPDRGYAPDTYNWPLWLPLVVLTVAAACLWRAGVVTSRGGSS